MSLVTDKPVLCTGATGFVAYQVIKQLLERGYSVRGTVRDPNNEKKLEHLNALPGSDRLTFVKANLLEASDFDPAVEGCEYVIHMASPYIVNVADPKKDLLDPALNGALNVLKACAKNEGIKRVVLTSSCAAISDSPNNDHIYTEEDWNTESNLNRNPYYYSKAAAEKAAWDYVKDEANNVSFDLVTVNPCLVIGPEPGPGVNASNEIIANLFTGQFPAILDLAWAFVDVRDVGKAHVEAIVNPEAKGRYLTANELVHMRDVVGALKEEFPEHAKKLPSRDMSGGFGSCIVKFGSRFSGDKQTGQFLRTNIGKALHFDNSKLKSELNFEFVPFKESLFDTIRDLEKKGAFEKKK